MNLHEASSDLFIIQSYFIPREAVPIPAFGGFVIFPHYILMELYHV